MLKAGNIANLIRNECGIAITESNDGKTVFDKEELLLIIAGITSKKQQADEKFIVNIVSETLKAQSKSSTDDTDHILS